MTQVKRQIGEYEELDYSVAEQPHMYPLVAQNSPFPPSLRSNVQIACYALPHTSAYQIPK